MIRTIPLATRRKIGGGMTIVRVYTMSDEQVAVAERAIRRTAAPAGVAEQRVRVAITHMLAGTPITEETHPEIVKMARWFRPLTTAQVEALPRTGCPDGWVQALILPIGTRRWTRVVRYDLTRQQMVAVNDAIAALTGEDVPGEDYNARDVAWQRVVTIVSRLLNGIRPTDDIERDLAEHFPTIRLTEMLTRCPEATGADIVTHTCRGGR